MNSSTARKNSQQNKYAEYESRKQEWLSRQESVTPEQYQRAVKKIADELGV